MVCAGPSRRFPVGDLCRCSGVRVPPAPGRATPGLGPSPPRRVNPEIPFTVDADPDTTPGKAIAAARSGQSGPASTGAAAVRVFPPGGQGGTGSPGNLTWGKS